MSVDVKEGSMLGAPTMPGLSLEEEEKKGCAATMPGTTVQVNTNPSMYCHMSRQFITCTPRLVLKLPIHLVCRSARLFSVCLLLQLSTVPMYLHQSIPGKVLAAMEMRLKLTPTARYC